MSLPQGFLDDNYEEPNLDRFLKQYEKRQLSVAVIDDAYTRDLAEVMAKLASNAAYALCILHANQ